MGKEGKVPYPTQTSVNPSAPMMVNEQLQQHPSSVMYPLLDPAGGPGAPPPYSDHVPPSTMPNTLPAPTIVHPVTVQPTYQHTTVVMTQIARPVFPAKPINITCWYCQHNIRTRTTGHATCLTWLLCGVLCGLGCFCGCCLIPFCTDGTRDIVHTCPNCKKYLGTKARVS